MCSCENKIGADEEACSSSELLALAVAKVSDAVEGELKCVFFLDFLKLILVIERHFYFY